MNASILALRDVVARSGKTPSEYQRMVVGRPGLLRLLRHDGIVTLAGAVPGVLGLSLRRRLYPRLLGRAGKNVVFGTNVVLRHPHKIFIADGVVIEDNVVLDAYGDGNSGIFLGRGVRIGRNSVLSCRNGDIRVERGVSVGINCVIDSESSVYIGEQAQLGPACQLLDGGAGIDVGRHVVLGPSVNVLDGGTIGGGTTVAAGSVVAGVLPAFSETGGSPARVRPVRRTLAARIVRRRELARPTPIPPKDTFTPAAGA